MWSEEFDNKFRGLHSSHNEPPFEEAAWDKMEKMLDIHLPREKKKRRGIIFWFTLAALGLLIPALILLTGKRHDNPVQALTPVPARTITSGNNPAPQAATTPDSTPATGHYSAPDQDALSNDPGGKSINPPGIGNIYKPRTIVERNAGIDPATPAYLKTNSRKRQGAKQEAVKNRLSPANAFSDRMPAVQPGTEPKNANEFPAADNGLTATPDERLVAKPADRDEVKKAVTDSTHSQDSTPARKISKPGESSPIAITVSLGPDISSVGLSNAGTTRIQFGAGISYDLGKRFTIRTGFYAARKVYDADSADYHPPAHFWNYYSNLQQVNANCLVFEIPVTVAYRFAPSAKNSWFVAAGISSVIMKEETYGYAYKNAMGQPAYYTSRYKNENSHLFSVINLSGGYQANLSKRFSLAAEPYFKLPIAGIGYGKIRLNSYGLLLTASYHPFTKKEKK